MATPWTPILSVEAEPRCRRGGCRMRRRFHTCSWPLGLGFRLVAWNPSPAGLGCPRPLMPGMLGPDQPFGTVMLRPLHGRLRLDVDRPFTDYLRWTWPSGPRRYSWRRVHRGATSVAAYIRAKEDVLPKELNQRHASDVAVPSTAPRGRYPKSRAGWASKERSTPEGYNMEQHAWMFDFHFPQRSSGRDISLGSDSEDEDPVLPRETKSAEERNALRRKRVAWRQKASQYHSQAALRKYNRANNTKFEHVEIRAMNLFFLSLEGAAIIITSQLSPRIIIPLMAVSSFSLLKLTIIFGMRVMCCCAVWLGRKMQDIAMAANAHSRWWFTLPAVHMVVVILMSSICLVRTAHAQMMMISFNSSSVVRAGL